MPDIPHHRKLKVLPVLSEPGTLPLLGTSVSQADVVGDMIDDEGLARALLLLKKQLTLTGRDAAFEQAIATARAAHPAHFKHHELQATMDVAKHFLPDHYTISYYIYDAPTAPIPETLVSVFSKKNDDAVELKDKDKTIKNVPTIRMVDPLSQIPANPLTPLSPNALLAIHDAFATMTAQTLGRFRFVRVPDPKDADMSFGGITTSHGFNGLTDTATGSILLLNGVFSGSYDSWQARIALHEIGHSLGLLHPSAVYHKKDQPDRTSFYDTVMIYQSVNEGSRNSLDPKVTGYPVSLMPTDLRAYLRYYPIASDHAGGMKVGWPPGLGASDLISATLHRAPGVNLPVLFPQAGIAFQPLHDSAHDTLDIRNLAQSGSYAVPDRETDEGCADKTMEIKQVAHGISVSNPYHRAASFLPIHAETIHLAAGIPTRLKTNGDVQVVMPVAGDATILPQSPDQFVAVSGEQNRVEMNLQHLATGGQKILVKPGAEVAITLHGANNVQAFAGLTLDKFLGVEVPGSANKELRYQWHRRSNGEYTLTVDLPTPYKPVPPVYVTLRLDTNNPAVHAAFQAKVLQDIEIWHGMSRENIQVQSGTTSINADDLFPPMPPNMRPRTR